MACLCPHSLHPPPSPVPAQPVPVIHSNLYLEFGALVARAVLLVDELSTASPSGPLNSEGEASRSILNSLHRLAAPAVGFTAGPFLPRPACPGRPEKYAWTRLSRDGESSLSHHGRPSDRPKVGLRTNSAPTLACSGTPRTTCTWEASGPGGMYVCCSRLACVLWEPSLLRAAQTDNTEKFLWTRSKGEEPQFV